MTAAETKAEKQRQEKVRLADMDLIQQKEAQIAEIATSDLWYYRLVGGESGL